MRWAVGFVFGLFEKRLIFSLRLFSPCFPSRERWRHVRDNKWKYISKSIDVVYIGVHRLGSYWSRRLSISTWLLGLWGPTLFPRELGGRWQGLRSPVSTVKHMTDAVDFHRSSLFCLALLAPPIQSFLYSIPYMYIFSPPPPFPPTLPTLLFSIPFDVLWRTHKFGSLTVNGQTVGSHLFLALILMGPT